MRKIFKNIKLIFFLSFWCFYLHSEYFPLNGNLTPESLKINILSSNLSELILEVEIPGIFIKDTFVNNEVYQLIRVLKEDGYTDEVGKPLLPLINRTIAIPPQSGIYTEFEVIKDTFLNNLLIFPSQIGIVGDSIFPFIKDEIYTKNVFYPQERIRVGNPGILKDFRIVNISISPFSYNPVNKELIIYKKFRVNIQFSGIDTRNSLPSLPSKVNYEDVPFYKSLILNYEAFSPLQTVEPPGYLIITADEYYFTLSDFVLWKKKLGYNVILTKLSEITNPQNPDTHDIKEYIKYVYNTLGNLSYVLLIGDGAKNNPELPIFKYPDIYGNPDVYSDYYYCLLSGNDNFPDVYLGRFNVSNINQLSIMINKHFIYERYTPLNWNAKKVFLVAGIEGKPQMDSLYTKKKINICKDYLRPHNIPYTTAYGVDPTFDIINKIKTEINSGVGLVNYRGHGSEDKWAKLQYINSSGFCEFTTNDVKSFSNYNFLSIVLNVTCLNGSIQEPLECMVEAWTLYQGGGSVAALGATRETNTEVNKAFDRKIFETIYNFNNKIIGSAINSAKFYIISNYDEQGLRNGFMHAAAYVFLGDPSLRVWTNNPQFFQVLHPQSILPGQTFTVNVRSNNNPVKEAKVCIYKENEFQIVNLTDINGDAIFSISTSASPGKFYITVSKDNFKPYEGQITLLLFPPTNLTAQIVYTDTCVVKIILSWNDNSQYEDNYILEYKIDNSNWQSILLPPNRERDTIIGGYHDYQFRVRCKKGDIYSDYSNTVSVSPRIPDPSNLTLETSYPWNNVKVSFMDNSKCEDKFLIKRKEIISGTEYTF